MDLREIGSGQGDINKGNLVLQIQKLRNVAAPKNNQESKSTPRMLKYYLTDGKNNYQAIELEHISLININTLPGTKLLLKFTNILQSHGIYLLKPSNILNILGGKVVNLIEKWELNKKLAFHSRVRSAEEGGPPPWIPFGKKIIKITEQDKNFKSCNDKDMINKDNTEFEAQRQDAIAEAAKQGSKKVFGGGNKQLLDHSVQKIVDQGFNIDQAEYALKINRNNVDRALKLLQRNDNRVSSNNTRESREPKEPRGKRFEKKTDDTKPSSGKVSLFDFLENKLPAQLEAMEMTSNTNYSGDNFGNSRLDNNHYHERQHEERGFDNQQGKGRRGGNRGGRGAYQAPPRHSDDSKFLKKTNNENFNGNQYGSTNTNQGKPPRFQRNPQQSHYQQEQSNRGGKLFQSTDRHNNDSSSGYSKNSSKNQYNDNNNRHQNQSESFDSFNKQNDFKNNSKSHNKSSFEVGPRTFNPSIEKNSKQLQTNKYQVNNDDNNLKSNNRSNFEVGPRTFNPPSSSSSSSTDKNSKQIQANKYQGNKDVNNASRVFTGPSQRNDYVERNKIESNSSTASGGGGGCNWSWKKGDKCMAKYWEDNRYYNAEVSAVSSKTCVVQFKEFGNYEEVLQIDCMPITEDFSHTFINENKRQEHRGGTGGGSSGNNRAPRHEDNYSGAGMEFRRSGGNIHKKKSQQRRAQAIYQPPAQRGHALNARENL